MNSLTLQPLPRDWFQIALTLVLVAGFCHVMLVFDLLTLLAAAFTFQLWLHGYAVTRMYELVGNGQFWLVFALWGAMVAWAAIAGFRLVHVGRRLAATFGRDTTSGKLGIY
jgi:hypothetical protein